MANFICKITSFIVFCTITGNQNIELKIDDIKLKESIFTQLIVINNSRNNYLLPIDFRNYNNDFDTSFDMPFLSFKFFIYDGDTLINPIEASISSCYKYKNDEQKKNRDNFKNTKVNYLYSKRGIMERMQLLQIGDSLRVDYDFKLNNKNSTYGYRKYHLDKTKQYYVQLRYKFDSLDAQKYLGQATIDSLERATGAKLFYGELKSNKVPLVQD